MRGMLSKSSISSSLVFFSMKSSIKEYSGDIDSFPEWVKLPFSECPHSIYVIEGRFTSDFKTIFYEH